MGKPFQSLIQMGDCIYAFYNLMDLVCAEGKTDTSPFQHKNQHLVLFLYSSLLLSTSFKL